jgi:hypothetical protein
MAKLKKLLPYFVTFAIVTLIYLVYQFYWVGADRLAGNDGYYYLARAKAMAEQGLAAGGTQNYTPFTLWGMLNGDNTIGYILFILPLSLFQNPIIAAKIFSSILIGLIAAVMHFLLNKKLQKPLISGLLVFAGLFVNTAFFLKFTEIRALIIGVFLYFITLYILLIYRKRYWLLTPIAFLYVFFHTSAYLMLMPIALLFLTKPSRSEFKKLGKIALYIIGGMAVAFIIFPASNFIQIYSIQVVIPIIYLFAPFSIDGGYENKGDWRTPENLVLSNLFNILLIVIALVIFWKKYKTKKMDSYQTTSFIIFIVMVFLDLLSRRFSEYMAPSCLIFCTLWFTEIQTLIKEGLKYLKSNRFAQLAIALCLIAGLGIFGYKFYGKYIQNDTDNTNYQGDMKTVEPETWGVAKYIVKNIPAGSYIYNDAWEDFPSLFYKAPGYKYAAGMEVGFMYLYDKDMLKFYQDFRSGKIIDNSSDIIKKKFNSHIVLIRKGKYEKASIKSLSGNTTLLYEDQFYQMYAI